MKKNYSINLSNVKNVCLGALALFFALSLNAETFGEDLADAPTAGCPTAKRPLDFDGDGKTDPNVVRNTGGGNNGQLTWFTRTSLNGGFVATPFGIAGDYFVPGDFDGDGKSDIAVWRSGAQAYYYILRSQTNTFLGLDFGTTGDNPSVVGDYTGDGITDPAIYRAGVTAGAQSFWAYKASSGPSAGQVVVVQWGSNGDFPAPGDYDGDGKYDFAVQRNAGSGSAVFLINQSTAGFASFVWGTPTDVIVPGYYDNDCKTDVAVIRGSGGSIFWYIRNSTNGALQAYSFGLSATDYPTQGDYDGDGATDVAVWRPSATAGQSSFYWRRSIDGALGVQPWGQNGDYPVANFNSH